MLETILEPLATPDLIKVAYYVGSMLSRTMPPDDLPHDARETATMVIQRILETEKTTFDKLNMTVRGYYVKQLEEIVERRLKSKRFDQRRVQELLNELRSS